MKLEKDGTIFNIQDEIQIKAFLDSGYKEVSENVSRETSKKKPKKEVE